ncbi:MAG: neutral/alkaline non-lysosomal ceramidase N-terminal domain-containing protein [Pseudomonadota bacterium]|nr:neutral/alkaline non-lysosomal ceramidase N-terminal domain-containing protein [Pseudomonadota bacterium]
MMRHTLAACAAALLAATAPAATAQSQTAAASPLSSANLRAGAARVDITPTAAEMPRNYTGVNDNVFARAIVVANGSTKAAMITVDVGAISTETWTNVIRRAESELGIPADQLILTATHTHSVPRLNGRPFEDRIFAAIQQADARLQPAQMDYGTGVSYVNVNRNIIDPENRRWWEGPNYEGVSDKTVAVVRFRTPDGKPIAVFYNYALHAVTNGQLDQISGDVPGAASRYLEATLGDDVVAVWSNGAGGDQNPIYFNQTYELRDIRIAEYATRGEDISNAMPPGGVGLDRNDPQVALLMDQQRQLTRSYGQLLGEEVLHIARSGMERPSASDGIFGAQKEVACPGRRRTNTGRAGYAGTYEDADPINIRLSFLLVGDVAIGGVNGEVFNQIARRFKLESPLKHTMFSSLTNGTAGSGYIPNDAAYGQYTFEVVSSRLKPGCAESAIVDGLLDLMDGVEVVPPNGGN